MQDTTEQAVELIDWIDSQPVALGGDWVGGLEERKREEAEFHDEYRAGHANEQHGTSSNHRFYEAATKVAEHTDGWIRRWASVPPATVSSSGAGNLLSSW